MRLLLILWTITMISCNNSRYIYIVRHSEKSDSTVTSGLSPAGYHRALALRDSLIRKKIRIIYATTIPATRETAAPLANALHRSIFVHNYNAIDRIVTQIKSIKNKNILVVDHRATMPAIIEGLTGHKITSPAVSEYGNLYIVRIKGKKTGLSFKHY
jgi:broad specificity phosphatase PhoE